MLRGLTRAGFGNLESEEQWIRLAAQSGFQAVDVDAAGLIARNGLEQAKALLEENNIVIGAIGLPVEWRADEAAFRAGLPALIEAAEAASALGCASCCTYILPSTDSGSAHFMALATRRIRVCADILDAYGIRLGLEFVGPHHLRTRWANPFIWTMEETLDWIGAIHAPNLGLLFDAYHWYTTGGTINDILQLKPEQIVHAHMNDAPDIPVEDVLDNDRLYTGEGVIDLAGFLRALSDIGYKGVVAQEVLTPEPPSASMEELMARSKSGFDKVFAQAGL
ncbi:sugar phosphate isomerase/epimerase [Xylanibacillus composti]|uniref:Sugar phosphate isomerase n=1 Tax=Xylanibacillus composti TaxID=1572762 RepID=A0A8J4M2S0_9BACL|nr:sugar phosphate isomerase/epimerase family protein [Xylanibacillus composti]MDT9726688.1 sugar phosphate isomerase/epimerase [Xylanibacillus composti]GIQ69380.1 sugar phosphate isomerase [Xylanibacillus composti]